VMQWVYLSTSVAYWIRFSHKKLIIPGFAAAISGDLEEEVKESEVLVGPREASQVARFLKDFAV